jgi:methyl-accepting chemotaxis protein
MKTRMGDMGLTTREHYRLFLYVNTFVIVLLGAAFAGWGVFWSFPAGLGEGYHNVQAQVREIGNVLFWRVAVLYAVISLLILLAMVVLHLLYSHRIAGPAYRIGRETARIAGGELTGNIHFRQKDNLTDMADSLNVVAEQYRSRINTVKDCLTVIEAQAASASDLIRQGKDRAALRQAAEAITSNVKRIERSLSEMRT